MNFWRADGRNLPDDKLSDGKLPGGKLPGEKLPVLWLVFSTFALLFIARFVDASLLNRSNENLWVVILQLVIFALPAVLYVRLRGGFSAARLRLSPPRVSHLLLILSASLALICGGLLLGIIFGGIDSLHSSFSLYDTFISKNTGSAPNTIYLIVTYAALPALCEEMVYRSVLCAELEGGGALRAVAYSSLFFGLLHFNLPLLPVYIYAGVILAMTMYISRSVLTAAAVHFIYNLFGLFSQPYVTTFYRTTGSLGLFIIIVTALFLISIAVFCSQAGRHYRRYSEQNLSPPHPAEMTAKKTLSSFLPVIRALPAILCIVLYLLVIIL